MREHHSQDVGLEHEQVATILAVRLALAEMEAGDNGRPADKVLGELREQLATQSE